MKKLYILTYIIINNIVAFSQAPITGKVTFKQILSYHKTFPDTIEAELDFASNTSIYSYDKNTNKVPKTGEVTDAAGMPIKSVFKGRYTDSIGRVVYSDLIKKNFITREIFQSENFIVPDTIPVIDWKIGTKHKTIADFDCRNAIGKYRGREYEAWFTERIPVTYGPWKLCGLPGLILEARSIDNEITFIVETIRVPSNINDIAAPTKGKVLKDYAAYRQLQDEKTANYARFVQSMGRSASEVGSSVKVSAQINRIEKSL